MLKKTVALGVCALSLMVGISSGHAEESVVIDMSVLESLGAPSSATVSHTKPLFPTVKKKNTKPKAKVKKAKKAKKKIDIQAPEVKTEEPKIEVQALEVKAEEPKIEVQAPEVKAEEPKIEVQAPEVKNEEPKIEVQAPEIKTEEPKIEVQAPEIKTEEPKIEVNIPQTKALTETKTEKQVVIITSAPKSAESGVITFTDDQSELSDVQKQQIDETLSSFKNPKVNKISIISYNLSGGDNVFQNKRISLNRAVNTRSYLLEKGYKNFSIKIINVESDDDRINTVSLTELKK